jgi:hypothetical protein
MRTKEHYFAEKKWTRLVLTHSCADVQLDDDAWMMTRGRVFNRLARPI